MSAEPTPRAEAGPALAGVAGERRATILAVLVTVTLWSSAFAGIAVISLGQSSGVHVDLEVLWPLLAALGTSAYFVFQKPLLRRYSALEMTTWFLGRAKQAQPPDGAH